MPKGGPDGGDGGRGGDVVLVCDDSLRDLESFRRRAHFKARRGGHGQGSLRHGADGETLEIPVPPGTEVLVERDGTRHDLVRPGQRALVARGGPGGRGNKRFAGPTHQTPRFAERGLPGEETWVTLQLKLLADVGLVGLPNAGKSSLLARLTRAHPKVADYPVHHARAGARHARADDRQLVIADIPGLIEGASAGAGSGPRVPGARRAHAAARPRARPPAARRLRPGRANHAASSASSRCTTRGWRRCRGCSRSRRPTWWTPRTAEAARERVAGAAGPGRAGDPHLVGDAARVSRAGADAAEPACRCGARRRAEDDGGAAASARTASRAELAEHRVFRPGAPTAPTGSSGLGERQLPGHRRRGSSGWSRATTSTTRTRSLTSSAGCAGSA